MERRRCRRFVWLAGFAVVALVVATLLIVARPKPLPPLPSPNGYDSFVQAGGLFLSDAGPGFDFPKLGHDALRRLIATNSESLRLLRLGLSQPCAVPINFAHTNCTNLVADLFSQLMKMRSLAYLLVAEGRLAELENRPADAARSYVECIRFGNESVRGGMLMNRLIGMSFEAIGHQPLVNLLPQLNPGELRGLTLRLDEIRRARVPWQEVMDMERRFSAHARRQSAQPLSWLVAEWQFLPRKQIARQKDMRIVVELSLLCTELALRCYQAENGKLPTQLRELTPKFLKDIPLDPYSGRPLVYHPRGTNWALYSVGPDRVDNGGVPITRSSSATVFIGPRFLRRKSPELLIEVPTGDVFYDSQW